MEQNNSLIINFTKQELKDIESFCKLNELEKALSLLPKELAVGFVINKAYYSRDKGYGYVYGYYAQ